MPRRIDVFFYGLFMDVEVLAAKGVEPSNVRRGSVEGYRLLIGRRASLVPDAASTAHGVVMSLPFAAVHTLYANDSLGDYRPEAVLVELTDGSGAVPALCFNLVEPPTPNERDPQYAAKLRALGERLGLPGEYVGG